MNAEKLKKKNFYTVFYCDVYTQELYQRRKVKKKKILYFSFFKWRSQNSTFKTPCWHVQIFWLFHIDFSAS